MARHTMRSSVVFVSVGEETRVFRSLDDVPADWRRRFQNTEPGMRPKTILIADRAGRDELLPKPTQGGGDVAEDPESGVPTPGELKAGRQRRAGDETARPVSGTPARAGERMLSPRMFGSGKGDARVVWPARQVAIELAIAAALCTMILWAFLRP